MTRLPAIDPANATGQARELLGNVQAKLGLTPNMMRTMANSAPVLEGYLSFSAALGGGKLGAKLREQIALITAEENQCGYCVAAHSVLGGMAGLSQDEMMASRKATAADAKTQAALVFAKAVVSKQGTVSDEDLRAVRKAGWSDGDIAEIIANVALNVFTNYFNHAAGTEIDFPKVPLLLRKAG
ncbi:MAG: carboxymuconolactone decarboxylase family protein [Bdellovibrionota bacterium]